MGIKWQIEVAHYEATRDVQGYAKIVVCLSTSPEQRRKELSSRQVSEDIVQLAPSWSGKGCSQEFSDFVRFADEEYARLGELEVYADVVAILHAVNDQRRIRQE